MKVAVPRETAPGEHRVALVPDAVARLVAAGFTIAVEREAGAEAAFTDAGYADAGAQVVERAQLLAGAEAVVRVGKPTAAEVEKAFDLDDQLRNVDAIFDRVFGAPAGVV